MDKPYQDFLTQFKILQTQHPNKWYTIRELQTITGYTIKEILHFVSYEFGLIKMGGNDNYQFWL